MQKTVQLESDPLPLLRNKSLMEWFPIYSLPPATYMYTVNALLTTYF